MARRNRRTGRPIVPIYKISGNEAVAKSHLPLAREYLMDANRKFGKNRSFAQFTDLLDGTRMHAIKRGSQFLIYVNSPFVTTAVPEGDCLLTFVVVPRYDHTKGLTTNPLNNLLTNTGQNRGILGHYSIGDLPRAEDTIPNDQFKAFVDKPLGIVDATYTTTTFANNISNSISAYNVVFNNIDNLSYDWDFKEQIEMTRDFDPITRGASGFQYGLQTGTPDVDQINNISQALSDLRAVKVGNIDWRSLRGEIYTIKGPSGRGVPATTSGMVEGTTSTQIQETNGKTADYRLYDIYRRYRGAARVDVFGNAIYKAGKAFAIVPDDQVVLGMCIKSFFNIATELPEEYVIAATVHKDAEFALTGITAESRTDLTFRSKLVVDDEVEMLSGDNWEVMDIFPKYNHNYPVFFSSSGNKAISTYQDQREEPGVINGATQSLHRHFESYSTIRTDIVNPTQADTVKTEEDPVVFPTTRVQTAIAVFAERRINKAFRPISQDWLSFIKVYPNLNVVTTLPEAEVKTRVSSDFKYQTEQEVYVEKRVKLKVDAVLDGIINLLATVSVKSEITPNDPGPVDGLRTGSAFDIDATMTVSYHQSFVGEFETNTTLTDLSETDIGLTFDPTSITSAPTTGTGTLQQVAEVVSRYDVTHTVDPLLTNSFDDLRDGEIQMTACDLRFGLAIYNIVVNDYLPYTSLAPAPTGDERPTVTGSDLYAWTTCPGRYAVELPDITSDIVQGASSPQSFHVGNLSYLNSVERSTQFLTGVRKDLAEYSGYLSYLGVKDQAAMTESFTFDYFPLGYGSDPNEISLSQGTDTTQTVNTSLEGLRGYVLTSPNLEQVLPLFGTGSSRVDMCGQYAKGQQLDYAIVGLDKSEYAAFTPWVEHLPGYDFDPSNDTLDPPGPKTNTSDIWEAVGVPQFIEPTQADKDLLMLEGDFLTEEYYKNLTIYRGIKSGTTNGCMLSYADSTPPEEPTPYTP